MKQLFLAAFTVLSALMVVISVAAGEYVSGVFLLFCALIGAAILSD